MYKAAGLPFVAKFVEMAGQAALFLNDFDELEPGSTGVAICGEAGLMQPENQSTRRFFLGI